VTFYRVAVGGALPLGDQWVCTFHIDSAQALNSVHSAAVTAFETFWTGTLAGFYTPALHLDSIVTTSLDPTTGKNVNQAESAPGLAGTVAAGKASPQRMCIVGGLRTALANKHGRGRLYLPAPEDSQITSTGGLLPACQAAVATGLQGMITTLGATNQVVVLQRAVRHLQTPPAPPTYDPPVPHPVTRVAVGLVLGSQRRRSNKVSNSYDSLSV
jgi:hypothetical protein